jgi:hypothetical protein
LGATAGFRGRLDSGDSAGAFAYVFAYVFAHVFVHFLARAREIMRGLEVHPELRRIPEVLREQKSGLGRDAALAANQFVDAVERDMQSAGKFGLRQTQRFEEFREQDLTGMGCDAKFWQHGRDSSVVVCAANLFTIAVRELEDDSILLVHADTVKTNEISPQLLQSVGGRHPQVLDGCAGIQQIEFLLHPAPELASNPAGRFGVAPVIDVGGRYIPKTGDHKNSIPEYSLSMYIFEAEAFYV